jgi:hypothetical protein
MVQKLAYTVKYIRMILIFMKNSILHLAIWDSKPFHTKRKIGTLICWDQWYPEAARLTLSGSESFVLSNSNGMAPGEEQYGENQYGAWMNIMKGHAVNGVICCCGKQNWFRAIFT